MLGSNDGALWLKCFWQRYYYMNMDRVQMLFSVIDRSFGIIRVRRNSNWLIAI